MKDIKKQERRLGELIEGKVALIVNTASACGFTPQYKGMEELYQKYKDQGFVVVAFPCNQFGAQEKGSEEEIDTFVCERFKASFPMMAKVDVNGDTAHPLYVHLKKSKPGFLGTEGIKWNFSSAWRRGPRGLVSRSHRDTGSSRASRRHTC